MLARLLTDAWLRSAGYSYTRGVEYARERRVSDLRVDDDANHLEAVVQGTLRYHVVIEEVGGALEAGCTCPVGTSVCKHIVATGIEYLASEGRVAVPAVPAAVPGSAAFESRKELEAFAIAHQVKHVLPIAADVLVPELRVSEQVRGWLQHSLGRLPLGEVGSRTGATRYLGGGAEAVVAVAEAAQRYVQAAAAAIAVALVEEQTPPVLPADAALVPLWERLAAARPLLRAKVPPRSRATRAAGTLRFDQGAASLVWEEPGRVWRAATYTMAPLQTTLAMPARVPTRRPGTPAEGPSLLLECTCGAPGGECTHALALVDTLLERLADPANTIALTPAGGKARATVGVAPRPAVPLTAVAEAMLQPGWARALAELDRFGDGETKAPTPIIVWWRIDEEMGSIGLTAVVKKQLKSGKLSSGSKCSPRALLDEYRDVLTDADRRVAEQMAAWQPDPRSGARATGSYPVQAMLALVGHPRVTAYEGTEPIAVRRATLGFIARDASGGIKLEPAVGGNLVDPELLAALLDVHAAGEPLVIVEQEAEQVLLVDVADEARRLWAVLQKHGDVFPPEAQTGLLVRLAKLESKLPIAVPPILKGRELAPQVTTVVRLRLLPDVSLELELFVRPAPGAPLFHPGAGPRDVMVVRDGERAYVRRNLDDEMGVARSALRALPMADAEEGPPSCFRLDDAEQALRLVAVAQEDPGELEVEWVDTRALVQKSVGVEQLRVTIDRKRDWFGITGDLKIESGRLELAVILDAARRQQRFVRVDEHRWIELSDALRQRLLAVSDQVYTAKGRLELSPGGVPAIRDLAAAGAAVSTAPAWDLLTDRLASSATLRPRVPASLVATLRDYQIEGHAWMTRVAAWGAGACLADDMGLGKTVQAIAVLIDRAKQGPALVLAPTSVAYNWVAELKRFAPGLTPILYGEAIDRAATLRKLKKGDVLIASYGLLVRDGEALGGVTFGTLILDEAQALKNPNTRRARAARGLDAKFRIALSGTPFENHLGELWSLFAIVFPGLLGSWEQFRERYAVPIEKTRDADARAALSRVLRPFLLRRTKSEVARELPARTEISVPVALSADEHALYEDARLAAVAELADVGKGLRDEQRRFQVLAALTRLRLLASHPKLYDPRSTVPSSKLRRALELLEELRSEGHRALVFSQFTSHLAIVRTALEAAGFKLLYLDGSTPTKERARLVAAFQAGEADAFLISLKAGGTGINLTAADYVLHLDPWWNPAVEDQATDRAHRIGQTRPVTVYRLIARGTIEEQILAMHGDKRALVAGVLEGSNVAARLTAKDLFSLLAGADATSPRGADADADADDADADDAEDNPAAAPPTVH